jgi:hypothetical protein
MIHHNQKMPYWKYSMMNDEKVSLIVTYIMDSLFAQSDKVLLVNLISNNTLKLLNLLIKMMNEIVDLVEILFML